VSRHPGESGEVLLTVQGLKTYFPVRGGMLRRSRYVRAVDGVDLRVLRGRTLGLVGESGSGKTTVGRSILRLVQPTAGRVDFDGHDVLSAGSSEMRRLRRRMQIIFQDPVGSLNPRMTVGEIVAEPLRIHTSLNRRRRRQRVGELLERVGLSSQHGDRYPHEFSGGQRQRIGIARALACEPDFIVCDEPVSALDVSIQAQILNLLADLQQELGLSYLFIAHNLAVVEHFAHEVAVMYLGKIVETAPRELLYSSPVHPYTRALLSAVPAPDPDQQVRPERLPGETPSPIDPPAGCAFHPRCLLTRGLASQSPPERRRLISTDAGEAAVMAPCVDVTPKLAPVPGDGAHVHACTIRQLEAQSGPTPPPVPPS
jgi:oligopeptide/dipeptide ABC transporter ATP-binding protein